jgi:phosphate acetyltransferase
MRVARMSVIERCIEAAKHRSLVVVLPEGRDDRVIAAAHRMKEEDIAEPVVLGDEESIETAAAAAGIGLKGIEIINPLESEELTTYAEAYVECRDLDMNVARRIVKRPLYYAGMMVAQGHADTMVAGALHPTASVIQAGALTVGLAAGIRTPSSFFLMVVPEFRGEKNKPFVFADCAVNIAPTPSELADIAIASEQSARKLLDEEPRVAMLSFSTKGSAAHQRVDRVIEALAIAKRKAGRLDIDGEFQVDAALIPAVAAKKVKGPSLVAGQANVLIFPDLEAGNIAYKLTQHMANAQAIGPFLQGFAKPISDLSRGASVEDIIATTAVCLAQAQWSQPCLDAVAP